MEEYRTVTVCKQMVTGVSKLGAMANEIEAKKVSCRSEEWSKSYLCVKLVKQDQNFPSIRSDVERKLGPARKTRSAEGGTNNGIHHSSG